MPEPGKITVEDGVEVVDQQAGPFTIVSVRAHQPGETFLEVVLGDGQGATQLVRLPLDPTYFPAPGDGAFDNGKGGFSVKPNPKRDRSHIFPTTAGMTP